MKLAINRSELIKKKTAQLKPVKDKNYKLYSAKKMRYDLIVPIIIEMIRKSEIDD